MTVAYFVSYRHHRGPTKDEQIWLRELLATTPGSKRALIHTPSKTSDPYLDDGAPPALVLQLYFPALAPLEAALANQGHLWPMVGMHALVSMRGAVVTQQAMEAQAFPVPTLSRRKASRCSYLVSYDGTTEDPAAWAAYYIGNHTRIMARFPEIREIEVYTPIEYRSFMPWTRADAMLRNKVVFDDADALTTALNSPVRHEMRDDFAHFPPFTGPVTHFPMTTIEATR